jgi:uncharacterized protein (TIGR03435 family)
MADGTTVITNQPIRVIFGRAAAEPVRDIENVPDWARDFYDITVKPSAGTDRTALPAMWKAMLADRLKLNAHVEHREKDGYALVLARSDGKLGPNLKPSDLDCTPRVQTSSPQPPPSPPTTFPAREDSAKRCGMQAGRDYIVSGGMTMERLAQLASGWVGGVPVNDRTGLQGFYSVEMNFPADNTRAAGTAADPAGSDELTALREQLGLKLEREKITIPVLVIDHIERPSEN